MCKRSSKWTTLENLRPGAVFTTRDRIKAVKSEYHYGNAGSQWECILLASGEFADFPDKNATEVRQIIVR